MVHLHFLPPPLTKSEIVVPRWQLSHVVEKMTPHPVKNRGGHNVLWAFKQRCNKRPGRRTLRCSILKLLICTASLHFCWIELGHYTEILYHYHCLRRKGVFWCATGKRKRKEKGKTERKHISWCLVSRHQVRVSVCTLCACLIVSWSDRAADRWEGNRNIKYPGNGRGFVFDDAIWS